jgi:hypothetical protein
VADPIDKGPAPASPLPWTAGPFPLGTSGMSLVETRDANGGHVLVVCRARAATDAADRANEASLCHRMNHWDALVAERNELQAFHDEARAWLHPDDFDAIAERAARS